MLLSEALPIRKASLYTEYMSILIRTRYCLLCDGGDIIWPTCYHLVGWPFQGIVSGTWGCRMGSQQWERPCHCLREGKFLLLCLTMYNLQSYQYDQVVHKLFSKQWNTFTSTEQESMSTWLLRASSVHSGSILSSCPCNSFPKPHVSNRAYFRSLIIQESY